MCIRDSFMCSFILTLCITLPSGLVSGKRLLHSDAFVLHHPLTTVHHSGGGSCIARNVVFYCLLVKANNAIFLANFYFCFAVASKGLVCKLAVEHQIRYTKRVDLPTDVAVQVVSLVLGGVVNPW